MDPIFVKSRLVSATVYGDLARVSREGEVELTSGVTRIAWPDLPADVDPADVRVETDRGAVNVVETEPVPVTPSSLPERPADQLRAELHRLIAAQEALRAEIELLDRVSPADESAQSPLRPDLFMRGLDAITDRRRTALDELRAASTAHTETARALERAEAGTREMPTHRLTLMVAIASTDPGPARVRVTYASGWATWRPLYHLQLSLGADRVEIVRYGDVWQDTGEDWTQVVLRLSTAEPQVGLRLASVKPWLLKIGSSLDDDMKSLYRQRRAVKPAPPAMTGALVDPSNAEAPGAPPPTLDDAPSPKAQAAAIGTRDFEPSDEFDEYATQFDDNGVFAEATSPGLAAARSGPPTTSVAGRSLEPAPPPEGRPRRPPPANVGPDRSRLVKEPSPREASGGIDVEIAVARPFDAKSGPDRHRVQLGRRSYPLALWYVLRPGLRDHAFGRAEIVNQDPDPILSGPTSLFVGGAFHGHTRLSTTPGRGKLTLDLGAETGIKCARRSETQVRREGLLTRDEIHAVQVTIDVESYLAVAVNVKVQDQVPVAIDPQIRVKLMTTTPPDAKLDDETGLVTFTTRLEPQSKRQITINYEVSAPAGFRLSQGLADEVLS